MTKRRRPRTLLSNRTQTRAVDIVKMALVTAALLGGVAAAAGCQPTSPTETPPAPQASGSGAVSMPAATSTGSASATTVIDIAIADGVVTPTNAEAQAAVGQPIVLQVSSDAADSLHVHSIPEQSFAVQARPDQRFEFTVQVPGRVDVELHNLHRTVVTIEVMP
ncbi:hypothetical protein NGTWS1803_36110 [Mycolicibacterium cyprinidarum]|uniref:EfeO-type cupredoxin-like domain-containing protein n=1 Tax=Mycolicibacterium cyprinidarum TaxID=2860311 RepID=A0ABQ4VCA8_9MYCO|nr:hypothetical protein NGTWS1702_35580 [Mycolicibacterium sp. NGTWSNA01]GJF17835.1 hypothetical protein NGTWS1803_36110 [Mycolicibacterium sp. NGTWS1803]